MKTIQEKNGEVEYVLTSEEYKRLHEANQVMLEALKKFSEYEAAMDAGNDIDGMLLYAELQAMSRAAIAKGEQA